MPTTGRFAPSPTNDFHLGNLRTALAAWLLARASGGTFLVRMEDLDRQRVAASLGAAERQLKDLHRIGLDWDGEVVYQSARTALYQDAINLLTDEVYPCFCTRQEIAEAASAPHDGFRAYPGTCAQLTKKQQTERSLKRSPALRVRANGAHFKIHDLHAGSVSGEVDDFVLVRGDGTPAYNLAVVVDDGLQGVTQVTRGSDLLSSAPRQGWLAARLGFVVPTYAHVSLVVNSDGTRLAKRDHSLTLTELLATHSLSSIIAVLSNSLGLGDHPTPTDILAGLPKNFAGNYSWWKPVSTTQLFVT